MSFNRSPAAIPVSAVAYTATTASTPPTFTDVPPRSRRGPKDDPASSLYSTKRRGSFTSFLRRGKSSGGQPDVTHDTATTHPAANTHVPAVPPITPAQRERVSLSSVTADGEGRASKEGSRNMLRKASKVRAEREQERIAKETAARLKVAPSLPQHSPLPMMGTFGGDGARQDFAPRSNGFHSHPLSQSPPNPLASNPQRAQAMPSSTHNSSSSPGYANSSSSPPSVVQGYSGEYVSAHPYERSESITNRGRYSYASSTAPVNVNSPRRIRRRKDPTPFNVLVIGAKNSGKTSFISFLRHSLALPPRKQSQSPDEYKSPPTGNTFTSQYLETDMDGERVGVTLWDSPGLEKNIVDLQLREMTSFVESKFEETFVEEQKVVRSPGVKDTHIHCVFLILDPVRLGMSLNPAVAFQSGGAGLTSSLDDDLDLQVLRALWGKTTVIPVISKADTATVAHMRLLKRAVWQSLKAAKLDPLVALELDEDAGEEDNDRDSLDERDEDDAFNSPPYLGESADESEAPPPKTKRFGHTRQTSLAGTIASTTDEDTPYIPMSILSPDPWDLPPYASKSKTSNPEQIGRKFPWGFADPYDAQHCDFTRLRDSIFSEWRADLRDLARTKWYENWRTSRLKNIPGSRQRIRGGVTPVASVPTEGRTTSPKSVRNFSTPGSVVGSGGVLVATSATIPRSVSAGTTSMIAPSPARPTDSRRFGAPTNSAGAS